MEIHVVRAGETLYTIAQSYSVDETILREANGVPPGGALAVGQTLVIQHPQTLHIVQPGQNLFGIARLYNLTLRQLYRPAGPPGGPGSGHRLGRLPGGGD